MTNEAAVRLSAVPVNGDGDPTARGGHSRDYRAGNPSASPWTLSTAARVTARWVARLGCLSNGQRKFKGNFRSTEEGSSLLPWSPVTSARGDGINLTRSAVAADLTATRRRRHCQIVTPREGGLVSQLQCTPVWKLTEIYLDCPAAGSACGHAVVMITTGFPVAVRLGSGSPTMCLACPRADQH